MLTSATDKHAQFYEVEFERKHHGHILLASI